jgi:hypothetical protein
MGDEEWLGAMVAHWRALPAWATDSATAHLWETEEQVGFCCARCLNGDRLTELRPIGLGRWWCPVCRKEKKGRRSFVLWSWIQWEPRPTEPGGNPPGPPVTCR